MEPGGAFAGPVSSSLTLIVKSFGRFAQVHPAFDL
jgi:hypothetical protein